MKIYIPESHLYAQLLKAIDDAPSIPPCQTTDPDLWYSDKEDVGFNYRVAKQLCSQCPVVDMCLKYAISANETDGIWGGLSPRERQRMNSANKRLRGRPKKYGEVVA